MIIFGLVFFYIYIYWVISRITGEQVFYGWIREFHRWAPPSNKKCTCPCSWDPGFTSKWNQVWIPGSTRDAGNHLRKTYALLNLTRIWHLWWSHELWARFGLLAEWLQKSSAPYRVCNGDAFVFDEKKFMPIFLGYTRMIQIYWNKGNGR